MESRQKLKMTININTVGISGSVLFWLGVITCLGGMMPNKAQQAYPTNLLTLRDHVVHLP
jgi:hypothetical protein